MGDTINRRDFLLKTAEAAGTAGALGGASLTARSLRREPWRSVHRGDKITHWWTCERHQDLGPHGAERTSEVAVTSG